MSWRAKRVKEKAMRKLKSDAEINSGRHGGPWIQERKRDGHPRAKTIYCIYIAHELRGNLDTWSQGHGDV